MCNHFSKSAQIELREGYFSAFIRCNHCPAFIFTKEEDKSTPIKLLWEREYPQGENNE